MTEVPPYTTALFNGVHVVLRDGDLIPVAEIVDLLNQGAPNGNAVAQAVQSYWDTCDLQQCSMTACRMHTGLSKHEFAEWCEQAGTSYRRMKYDAVCRKTEWAMSQHPVTVEDLSRLTGISLSALYRTVRELWGVTPTIAVKRGIKP